eukprot:5483089-Pyramimonas_sp.AAC.1
MRPHQSARRRPSETGACRRARPAGGSAGPPCPRARRPLQGRRTSATTPRSGRRLARRVPTSPL